jgi:hypothetical protein
MSVISVVVSTRKKNDDFLKHLKKKFSHPKTEFLIYENNGEYSLTEIYNKGLSESKNDIVAFLHDDIFIETNNITPKIIKLFEKNPEYGIIGVAGTDNLISAVWWEIRDNMQGQVKHSKDGKVWRNDYSSKFGDNLKEVVVIDGLCMFIHKNRIKHNFDEDFKDFHFYDLPICVNNFLSGVKIGVTTKIELIHNSIGETNKKWEKNKLLFEAKFNNNLPLYIKF